MEVVLISDEKIHIWLFYLVYHLIAHNIAILHLTNPSPSILKYTIENMNLSENIKILLNEYLDQYDGFLTNTVFYQNEREFIDSLYELPIVIFQKIVGGAYESIISSMSDASGLYRVVTYKKRPEYIFSPENITYQNRHLAILDLMFSDDNNIHRNAFHKFSNVHKIQTANALLKTASAYECNLIIQSIILANISHFMDMDVSIEIFKKFNIVGYLSTNQFKNANKYIWYRRKNFAIFNKALVTSIRSIQQQNKLLECPIFPLNFGKFTIIMVNRRFVRHLATFM